MLNPLSKTENVVVFHINELSRNSKVIHIIFYNEGYQIAKFLVSSESDISKHLILVQLAKIMRNNLNLLRALMNRCSR